MDQPNEQNFNQWVFRFKYEAGNPLCPGQQPANGNQGNWFNITGAQLRSSNAATDFGLLELNGNLHFHPDIAFAGWNRNTTIPTQVVTGIHHPRGDAKKISNDNEALITTNPNMWIVQRWDTGLVEPGSSGSPIFDGNNRIFGQLNGGDLNIGCNPTTGESFIDNNRYGRFNLSWIGGGTNTTRLSNWLGGANPPTTTNTIRAAHITPFVANNGTEFVCTTNKLFTLNNQIAGTTVSWSVSNAFLFAISGGASTSGTGTNATLRAVSSGASGSAVLTFTMNGQGCGQPITVTRQIWVGIPGLPATSPSGTTPIDIGVTQYHTVYLSSTPGATSFTADWSASGAVSRLGGNFPATYATFVGNYVGTGNWQVTTSNVCGTRSNFGQYNVTNNCNPCPRIKINNPVQNELIVTVPEYHYNSDDNASGSELKGDFILLDQNGMSIKVEIFTGNRHSTNVGYLKSGMYILRMKCKDFDLSEKVIIIK